MKIGVIGFGFVGQAVSWAYRDFDLVIRDPKLEHSASLEKFADRDAIFICVPSPCTAAGECDSSILEQVLAELLFVTIQNPNCVFISKSTAPPSVYKSLQKQYPNLVHAPEFLTQNNAVVDYANASYCVLGGNYDWAVKARTAIHAGRRLVHDDHIIVNIETAALYKYFMNSYLATKVTFMNDFKKLANAEGVNWQDIVNISKPDDRIGMTHMQVPGPDGQYGWGGACFPKDVDALLYEAATNNVELDLLKSVKDINTKHRSITE